MSIVDHFERVVDYISFNIINKNSVYRPLNKNSPQALDDGVNILLQFFQRKALSNLQLAIIFNIIAI